MKKKNEKHLFLAKETIAKLNPSQLQKIMGGGNTKKDSDEVTIKESKSSTPSSGA